MPLTVEIPEIGEVEFPDSMTEADIAAASSNLYGQRKGVPPAAQPLPQPPAPPDTPEGRELVAMLEEESRPRGALFARPGVLARSPADIAEAFQAIGGQLLHPIKSTEAAIEQFTGAPKFTGAYAPPVKHVSEILELGPKIPKIAPQKGTVSQAAAGAANALLSFADFFLTPGGASTIGIGSLPQAAKKAVLTDFAAVMAVEAPEQLREGVRLLQEGKVQEGTQHLTSGTGGMLLSAKIASHVPEPPFAPQKPTFAPTEPSFAEKPPSFAQERPPFAEAPKAPEPPARAAEPVPAPETAPTAAGVSATAIPEQTVRLWRGETPPVERSKTEAAKIDVAAFEPEKFRGKWWTEQQEVAERFTKREGKSIGELYYVDVPKSVAEQYRISNLPKTAEERAHSLSPSTEFILPEELTAQKQKAPTEAVQTTPEPAIAFPGIGSLREKQATAMELGKIRKSDPELWKAITQMFGTDQPAKIAKMAKTRMEESKIPPPDVEQRAMLAGSHIAGIPDPISLAFAVTFGTKTGRQVVGDVVRFYSEPLAERIATEGGNQAKAFGQMSREIAQRAKELYGSLTDALDPALVATGKANSTTTWLNDLAPTKKRWGFRNAQQAVEGPIDNVPAEHRPTVELLKTANLRIGQLAEQAVLGFKATGKYQRAPTALLVDIIRSGKGDAFDLLKNSLAAENKIRPAKVRDILLRLKAEFDAPGSQQTIHRIAQEFERHFPKFPTDLKIRTPLGDVWMPVLHAKPFEYLQNAALQTAQRTAFLERIPQGALGELRKGIVSELKSPEAFDDLVRALHGLPINEPLRMFAPGTLQSMIAQGANRILTDVFGSLKLTASAIYNIPETVLGNTPAFFGWRNFARGTLSLKERWAELEKIGAINRAIYNFSFDPKAPVRTILGYFRQGLRKATAQQFFNEMQEMLAASTAQVFAERASGKLLSPREQGLFTETAVAMGYTRLAARAMAEGRGTTQQYGGFTRRAAAFTTGGNIQGAELSRFGGNRVSTSLFRFQSYPMMKLNSFRKAYMNFAEAVESKDPRRIKASSEQLAKFLFNTTAQGAAAAFLAALLSGRGGGVQQTAQEAEDNPGKFIFDSLAGGMGGPVAAINYVVGTGKSRDLLNPKNINAGITFPGSIYLELKQLFNREGPYAGMPLPNAAQKYLETRVPAGKMIRHALEEAGLAPTGDTAGRNIYRIHQDWLKRHPDENVREDYEREQQRVNAESEYSAVYAALRTRDLKGLEKAVADLESKNIDIKDIKKAVKRTLQSGKRLFHDKKELEEDFADSLTPAQRRMYEQALDERQEQWDFLDSNF